MKLTFESKAYLLTFLLIALSTIPLFKTSLGMYLMLGAIVVSFRKMQWNRSIVMILIAVFILEGYHYFFFRNYDFLVVKQVLLFFLIAAYVIQFTKGTFLKIFIHILYLLTVISLVIFGLSLVFPSLITGIASAVPSFFVLSKNNIYSGDLMLEVNPVLYNFGFSFKSGRNSGPFWEATVFASMILIAQIFNGLINKRLFNKEGWVFTIGIATTFSTTIYVAYFILVTAYFLIEYKTALLNKIVIVAMLVIAGLTVFEKTPFLKQKIMSEFENNDKMIDEFGGDSRVASCLLDIMELTQNPQDVILGRGSDKQYRIQAYNKEVLRNCGLSAFLVEWGIGLFAVYVTLIFVSFRRLCRYYGISTWYAYAFGGVLLISTFSEVFLDTPLYHIFPMIGFLVPSTNVQAVKKRHFTLQKHTGNMLPAFDYSIF